MAHCARCNKFMLLKSSSGYCKDCYATVKAEKEKARREEEARRKVEEERKRQEEARRKAEEERKRKEEEARRKAEEERKRREEEERIERERKLTEFLNLAKHRCQEGQFDEETFSVINNALKLANVLSAEWQLAQTLLSDVKAEIANRENEKRYTETMEQFKVAETLPQLKAVRESFLKLAKDKYKDSQKKVEECEEKIVEQEVIIAEQKRVEEEERKRKEEEARRKAEEERKRREEEERIRKLEAEKTVDMGKCSIRLPFTYDICYDLRNKGVLLAKDKETGKSYCLIKEISTSDEYLKRYFDEKASQEQDKEKLRYQYAEESVLNDPFNTLLGETEWVETNLGRVMINQIEKKDKQRFYSCIIFFDELEFVFEYYPAKYDPTTDLQTINHALLTIRNGSAKERSNRKTVSRVEATKKAEAWMVKPENRGTLLFFSMWLSHHDGSSLKQQMILKFREKGALTEDEIEAVDYSYLIRSLNEANPF